MHEPKSPIEELDAVLVAATPVSVCVAATVVAEATAAVALPAETVTVTAA